MEQLGRIEKLRSQQPKTIDAQRIAPFASVEVSRPSSGASLDEIKARNEARQAEIAAADRYAAANVPLRYRATKTVPKSQRWAEAHRKLSELTARAGSIVILTGAHGTGKTHLACDIIKGYCATGSARYETWADIGRRWREAIVSKDGESERRVLTELDRPSLLIIDEIEVGKDGEFADRNMRELLDRRYRNLKTTVLLSNLSPEALEARLDPSVLSRISETGGIIVCDWASFRGAA
ncbi:MAG: ATP-binding protein [Planctomycetes bacterium]|nr:ATP-binding protein [Planctomycetota bacterium]